MDSGGQQSQYSPEVAEEPTSVQMKFAIKRSEKQ
jgi:hypothetical protein